MIHHVIYKSYTVQQAASHLFREAFQVYYYTL